MADSLTLGGLTAPITLPSRFAEREELVFAVSQNQGRGYAACLGLCAPGLVWPRPDDAPGRWDPAAKAAALYRQLNADPLEFGAEVYSALRTRGIGPGELIEAAGRCYQALVVEMYPRKAEVDAAEDFTDPSAAPQT